MMLCIVALLFTSTVAETSESATCPEVPTSASLVQRDAARTKLLELLPGHGFPSSPEEDGVLHHLWRGSQALYSQAASMLETFRQKPQSHSSWLMLGISAVFTIVFLIGGFMLLARVQKSWHASHSRLEAGANLSSPAPTGRFLGVGA
ncbi:unnamed protein product [Effrenium voratum]|nr:unnamed protein product [Effrenium voratum]